MTGLPAALVAERLERALTAARTVDCPSCGRPTLTARTPDRVAAIDVRADPTPIHSATETTVRAGGRHTWCLDRHPQLPARIRWRCYGRTCTHPVIADHHCPPRPATPVQETLI